MSRGSAGGLISAFLLARKCRGTCKATVFESGGRLGGKLQTRTFSTAPVPYEAGYDLNYADQSHVIKDMREFSGYTQAQARRSDAARPK